MENPSLSDHCLGPKGISWNFYSHVSLHEGHHIQQGILDFLVSTVVKILTAWGNWTQGPDGIDVAQQCFHRPETCFCHLGFIIPNFPTYWQIIRDMKPPSRLELPLITCNMQWYGKSSISIHDDFTIKHLDFPFPTLEAPTSQSRVDSSQTLVRACWR